MVAFEKITASIISRRCGNSQSRARSPPTVARKKCGHSIGGYMTSALSQLDLRVMRHCIGVFGDTESSLFSLPLKSTA